MSEKKIFFLIYFMLGIKIILSTSIVNAETIIKTIPVEKNPLAEVISNDGKFVYVINNGSNSVSVIDPGYRGEIQVRFNRIDFIHKDHDDYQIGDRVAQIIIVQVPSFLPIWAEELEDSERGADGFGSSGK